MRHHAAQNMDIYWNNDNKIMQPLKLQSVGWSTTYKSFKKGLKFLKFLHTMTQTGVL